MFALYRPHHADCKGAGSGALCVAGHRASALPNGGELELPLGGRSRGAS
jgi:hypothetical protein